MKRIKYTVYLLALLIAVTGINAAAESKPGREPVAAETKYTRDFNFGLKDIGQAIGDSVYERYTNKKAELPDEIPVFEPFTPDGKTELYVSPTGDNNNPGTIEKPFKTVQHALNYVREVRDKSKGVVIYIREGSYDLSDGLVIPEYASGCDEKPLIISNYNGEKVNFVGGASIPGSSLKTADDELAKRKLPENVLGKVLSVDLKALGINDYGTIDSSGPPKLLVNGTEYTLARYPNAASIGMRKYDEPDGRSGVLRIGPITYSGSELGKVTGDTGEGFEFAISDSRPFTWENTGDIWMYGSWYAEWLKEYVNVRAFNKEKMSVSTVQNTRYGAKYDKDSKHYYFNVLEELDSPGEWFIDRNTGKLYIYPISDDIKDNEMLITTSKTDIVRFDNCDNVVLNGITIEGGGQNGISMNGRRNLVQNCTVQDVVGYGVSMYARNSGVISSTIRRTGNYAIDVHSLNESRGVTDLSFLTPTRNFVQNCYIYDVLRGIYNNGGVQNIFSHNCVMNTRAMGINIGWGNEIIVEYNEVGGGPNVNFDSAQLYINGNGMGKGDHIRYNYFHDALADESVSQHTHCIYFDDRASGHYAYGNIIKGGGFFSHGGSDNVVENNIIVDVQKGQKPLGNSDNYYVRSEDRWADWVVATDSVWHGVTNYSSIYNSAWWSRYPEFYEWAEELEKHKLNYDSKEHKRDELEDYLRMPRYTVIKDNVLVNTDDYNDYKPIVEYKVRYENNVMYKNDPGFADYKKQIYDFRDNAKIFTDNPDFKRLPSQSKMGVILDDKLLTKKPGMNDIEPISPVDTTDEPILNSNIILKWTQAYCSNHYDIEVARDAEFKNVVYKKRVAQTELELPELDFGEKYYWRVTAGTKIQCVDNTPKVMKTACFKTYTQDEAYRYIVPDTYSFNEDINDARKFAAGIFESGESTETGTYKTGTRALLEGKIKYAENIVSTERIQSRLNSKQTRFKRDFVGILGDNAEPYTRKLNGFNEDEWQNSNPSNSKVEYSADKSQMTVSSKTNTIMYYNKPLSPKETFVFSVKYNKLEKWTSIGLKQVGSGVSSPTLATGYYVVVKPDVMELQKMPKPSGASDGIIAVAENNGIIKEGQWYEITTLAETVENGVRCVFSVGGKPIFDYTDTVDPVYDIGCFAIMHNAGNDSMVVSKAK